MATKKMGAMGKYGTRYGTKVRKRLQDLEKLKKDKVLCPSCKKDRIKRVSAGIWLCKRCGFKMAGRAHRP